MQERDFTAFRKFYRAKLNYMKDDLRGKVFLPCKGSNQSATGVMRLFDRFLQRLSPSLWRRAVSTTGTTGLAELRQLRSRARQTQRQIDQLLFQAEERLLVPRLGSNAIERPLHCDWAWRPQLWRGPMHPVGASSVKSRSSFTDEVTLFHDCTLAEIAVRQMRNTREDDFAPFGLRLEVFAFEGTFLSLAIDLPAEAAEGLKRRHVLRLNTIVESEQKIEIFARLNVRHGPNTEQIVRDLPLEPGASSVEFDLAHTKLNEKRVEKLWLDLIFENPQLNQITLRDVTLTRRPRAEF